MQGEPGRAQPGLPGPAEAKKRTGWIREEETT